MDGCRDEAICMCVLSLVCYSLLSLNQGYVKQLTTRRDHTVIFKPHAQQSVCLQIAGYSKLSKLKEKCEVKVKRISEEGVQESVCFFVRVCVVFHFTSPHFIL